MKPAEIPILLPTKFDLTINLKTAKARSHLLPELVAARRRSGSNDRFSLLNSSGAAAQVSSARFRQHARGLAHREAVGAFSGVAEV
jgi:hypothetical protein